MQSAAMSAQELAAQPMNPQAAEICGMLLSRKGWVPTSALLDIFEIEFTFSWRVSTNSFVNRSNLMTRLPCP